MTTSPLNAFDFPAAQAACLGDIDHQVAEHDSRRLAPSLAHRSVASGRAIIADLRGEPLFSPWTSRIDAMAAAERVARQQEGHQDSVLRTMSEHARQLFTLGARETEAANHRATQATHSVSTLEASARAAEQQTLDLERNLAQLGGSPPDVSPAAPSRPGEVDTSLDGERAVAQAANGQVGALVALWAHDVGQLRDDCTTICNVRHRFFTDMVGLQEDIWRQCPRVVVPHAYGGTLVPLHLGGRGPGPSRLQHHHRAHLLNRGRALIDEFQTASFALGQFYRESVTRLSDQQTSVCRDVQAALGASLAAALRALEQQAVQKARLAASQARVAVVQEQLTTLAAAQLCLRAGLAPQSSDARESDAPRATPKLRRA